MYIGLRKEVKAYYDERFIKILNTNSGSFRLLSKRAAVLVFLLNGCRKLNEVKKEFCYLTGLDTKNFKIIVVDIFNYIHYADSTFDVGINEICKEHLVSISTINEFIKLEQPENIFIRTTNFCDKECKYCCERENMQSEVKESFPVSFVEKIIENMDSGRIHYELTGGEPLICKELELIIDEFKKHKLQLAFITKGTSNYSYFEKIIGKKVIHQVCFSLDSCEKEYVNYITGDNRTFDNIIECMKIAKKNHLVVDVNAVITSGNINDIENLAVFCLDRGVSNLHLTTVWPVSDIEETLALNYDQKNFIYRKVQELKNKYSSCINIELTVTYCDVDGRCLKCGKPFTDVKIFPNGKVSLCNGEIIGDLQYNSLYDIWNGHRSNEVRSKLMKQMTT